jgi:predicted NBD/HSP70 family sugar kinase
LKDAVVIGIDLGGTNFRLALVSLQGKILYRRERATASMPDQAALVAALAADLTKAGEAAQDCDWEIKGAGIGGPGAGFAPGRPGGLFPQRGGFE